VEDSALTIDNPSLSLSIAGLPKGTVEGCHAINCTEGSLAHVQSIAKANPSDNASLVQSIALTPLHSVASSPSQTEARYLQASLSDATKRAYRADISAFLAAGGSIPASPAQVACYLAGSTGNLSPVTLRRRAVAIGKAHVVQGYTDPTKDERVQATLRGISRLHGRPQRQAAPLLREDLLTVLDALPGSLAGARDRALLLVGFAGGFRRSELVGLDVADVAFVPEGLLVTLRRSKTDQEGVGRKVGIPHGRTRACPVKALRVWLEEAGIVSGPLFRQVNKGGWIGSRALTDQSVSLVLRKCAVRVGLPCERLSGHSLRAGLVTSAAKIGVSSWKIRQQTGHRSDAMLQRYIRDADIFVENAAGAVL
jgi:integrase